MSGFLLDTVALSATRVPARNPAMQAWLDGHRSADLYLSTISFGEIERGIATARDRNLAEQLRAWLENVVEVYTDWTLAFDIGAARYWGERLGALAREGVVVSVVDSMIAATAIVNKLTVVTLNTRHFTPFGVSTVNPWEGEP